MIFSIYVDGHFYGRNELTFFLERQCYIVRKINIAKIVFIALIFTDDYFAALDAADDAAFLTLQLRVHFKVLLAGVSLPVTAQSHIVAGIVYYIVIFIDNHDVVKAVDEQTSYTKHFIFLLYYVAAYLHLPQLLHG